MLKLDSAAPLVAKPSHTTPSLGNYPTLDPQLYVAIIFEQIFLADLGKASGCSTNSAVIRDLLSDPFPPLALWCRQSPTF